MVVSFSGQKFLYHIHPKIILLERSSILENSETKDIKTIVIFMDRAKWDLNLMGAQAPSYFFFFLKKKHIYKYIIYYINIHITHYTFKI